MTRKLPAKSRSSENPRENTSASCVITYSIAIIMVFDTLIDFTSISITSNVVVSAFLFSLFIIYYHNVLR